MTGLRDSAPSIGAEPGRHARSGYAILEAHGLIKRFFGVTVLDGISMALHPGEVRALLGENGAGKSTMINLLSGVHQPDGGKIMMDGKPVRFTTPIEADHAGLSVIRQELSLFPDLSVAEAVFAGHLPTTRFGLIDWSYIRDATRDALARLELSIDVRRPVASLSVAEQQLVEIARALTRRARIVIMDEPTASLSPKEVRRLGEIIEQLSGEGVGILYVSHRLDEVKAFCGTYTVLRDGHAISEGSVRDTQVRSLIHDMVGRHVETRPVGKTHKKGKTVLEVRNLASELRGRGGQMVSDVSFTLREGEILALAGIVGAGRTETARMIFGLDPVGSGEIRLDDVPFQPRNPATAMKAGIGYVSEDRKDLSILPQRSVLENFALTRPVQTKVAGILDRKAERAMLETYRQRLTIRTKNLSVPIATLSGGNQQKVMLSRWIARRPRVLIIDEPTRGVDVGAKEDVHDLIRQIAADGIAVLLISSDMPEILVLADRVVTLLEGRVTAEIDGSEATSENLMAKMTRHD